MKKLIKFNVLAVLCGGFALTACGSSDDSTGSGASEAKTLGEVKSWYAQNAEAAYGEATTAAQALADSIDALVEGPSQETLDSARAAWLAAREPYDQTDVYRFYDGPIDGPEGPEGRINAWPLDEAFIDSVKDDPEAGIINDVTGFPELTVEVLVGANERGGEKNIATGYHAIEFLLWGQDQSTTGPGDRPFTDYVAGEGVNADRRGQYLQLVAKLLVEDLESVRDAWTSGYRADFEALDEQEALHRILLGMGSLSGAELSGERMTVAYDNKDQEDEHSCFSDNTKRDLFLNAQGIENVYMGKYGSASGAGLSALVRLRDKELDTEMQANVKAVHEAMDAIPAPFDQAILGDDSAPGRVKMLAAIRALQTEAETIVAIASAFDVEINLE